MVQKRLTSALSGTPGDTFICEGKKDISENSDSRPRNETSAKEANPHFAYSEQCNIHKVRFCAFIATKSQQYQYG